MEDYDRVMRINATGSFLCTQALCRAMQGQEPRSVVTRNGTRDIGRGSIVNVASAMSYAAVPGKVAYTAAKHALLGITKTAGEFEVKHARWTGTVLIRIAQLSKTLRWVYASTRCVLPGFEQRCMTLKSRKHLTFPKLSNKRFLQEGQQSLMKLRKSFSFSPVLGLLM